MPLHKVLYVRVDFRAKTNKPCPPIREHANLYRVQNKRSVIQCLLLSETTFAKKIKITFTDGTEQT